MCVYWACFLSFTMCCLQLYIILLYYSVFFSLFSGCRNLQQDKGNMGETWHHFTFHWQPFGFNSNNCINNLVEFVVIRQSSCISYYCAATDSVYHMVLEALTHFSNKFYLKRQNACSNHECLGCFHFGKGTQIIKNFLAHNVHCRLVFFLHFCLIRNIHKRIGTDTGNVVIYFLSFSGLCQMNEMK